MLTVCILSVDLSSCKMKCDKTCSTETLGRKSCRHFKDTHPNADQTMGCLIEDIRNTLNYFVPETKGVLFPNQYCCNQALCLVAMVTQLTKRSSWDITCLLGCEIVVQEINLKPDS